MHAKQWKVVSSIQRQKGLEKLINLAWIKIERAIVLSWASHWKEEKS